MTTKKKPPEPEREEIDYEEFTELEFSEDLEPKQMAQWLIDRNENSRKWGHLTLPPDFDPALPLRRAHWEHFCQYIALQGLMPEAAYLAIGGRGKHPRAAGLKLRSKPMPRERINWLQKERVRRQLEDVSYTRDDVLRLLFQNINDARTLIATSGTEIVRGEDGRPLYKPDVKAVNAGIELLGREIGMFPRESKVQITNLDGLEGMDMVDQLRHLKHTLWEASDGAIDLDTNALLGLLSPDNRNDPIPVEAGEQPGRPLQAISEAEVVSLDGEGEAREAPAGGEPTREDDGGDG